MTAEIIREIAVAMGLQWDGKGADTAESAIGKLKGIATQAAAAVASIGAVRRLVGIVEDVGAAGEATARFAAVIGISAEKLSELEGAGQLAGVSADEVRGALQHVAQQTYAVSRGSQEAAKGFALAGVSMRNASGKLRDPTELLGAIADRMAKIPNPAKRAALATQLLGGSAQTLLPFLLRGRDGIKDLGAEARDLGIVLSDDTVKASVAFQGALRRTEAVTQGLQNRIGAGLLPVFTRMLDRFNEFYRRNRSGSNRFLEQSLKLIGQAAEYTERNLYHLVNIGIGVVRWMGGAEKAAKFLGIAIGVVLVSGVGLAVKAITAMGVRLALSLAGAVLAGAAFIALALIAEDLYRAFTGQSSALKTLLETYGKPGNPDEAYIVQIFRSVLTNINEAAAAWNAFVSSYGNNTGFVDFWSRVWEPIIETWKAQFSAFFRWAAVRLPGFGLAADAAFDISDWLDRRKAAKNLPDSVKARPEEARPWWNPSISGLFGGSKPALDRSPATQDPTARPWWNPSISGLFAPKASAPAAGAARQVTLNGGDVSVTLNVGQSDSPQDLLERVRFAVHQAQERANRDALQALDPVDVR